MKFSDLRRVKRKLTDIQITVITMADKNSANDEYDKQGPKGRGGDRSPGTLNLFPWSLEPHRLLLGGLTLFYCRAWRPQ